MTDEFGFDSLFGGSSFGNDPFNAATQRDFQIPVPASRASASPKTHQKPTARPPAKPGSIMDRIRALRESEAKSAAEPPQPPADNVEREVDSLFGSATSDPFASLLHSPPTTVAPSFAASFSSAQHQTPSSAKFSDTSDLAHAPQTPSTKREVSALTAHQRLLDKIPPPVAVYKPAPERTQSKLFVTEQGKVVATPAKPTKKSDVYLPPQRAVVALGDSGSGMVPSEVVPPRFLPAFSHISTLTRVQAGVARALVDTDESVVIHAPTGSGKTLLFELALTRLFSGSRKGAKAWYLGPLRALCQERTRDWSKRFGALGIRVVELTGDSDEAALQSISSADLVVATPEKLDVLTRRSSATSGALGAAGLLCVDEVHLLGAENRGACLEATVSRLMALGDRLRANGDQSNLANLRIVAASATVPNAEHVATWLKARPFTFPASDRPVPLRTVVDSVPRGQSQNDFLFQRTLTYRVPAAVRAHAQSRPTLVFCSTRQSTIQTAQNVADHSNGGPWPSVGAAEGRDARLASLARSLEEAGAASVAKMVRVGVAAHHAGLPSPARHLIEAAFCAGDLSVLCSTSTLAQGVNLPARLVVVVGSKQYASGGYVNMTSTQLQQMAGRAGRPGHDTEGVAVFLCGEDRRFDVLEAASGKSPVVSQLHNRLGEQLNAEAVLGAVSSVAEAKAYLQATFLNVHCSVEPERYLSPAELAQARADGASPSDWLLTRSLSAAIERLVAAGAVSVDGPVSAPSSRIAPTRVGQVMSRRYVSLSSIEAWNSMTDLDGPGDLLRALTMATEFGDLVSRRDERKMLNGLNANKNVIRFPYKKSICTGPLKAFLVIQCLLCGLPNGPDTALAPTTTNPTLRGEISSIMQQAPRLSAALLEVAAHHSLLSASVEAARLEAALHGGSWGHTDSFGRPLIQLPGVGRGTASSLAEQGVISFDDVRNCASLAEIMPPAKRGAPTAEKLSGLVAALPTGTVAIDRGSLRRINGEVVSLKVTYTTTAAGSAVIGRKGRYRDAWALIVGCGRRACLVSRLHSGSCGTVSVDVLRFPPAVTDDTGKALPHHFAEDGVVAHLIHLGFAGIEAESEVSCIVATGNAPELVSEALNRRKILFNGLLRGQKAKKPKKTTKKVELPDRVVKLPPKPARGTDLPPKPVSSAAAPFSVPPPPQMPPKVETNLSGFTFVSDPSQAFEFQLGQAPMDDLPPPPDTSAAGLPRPPVSADPATKRRALPPPPPRPSSRPPPPRFPPPPPPRSAPKAAPPAALPDQLMTHAVGLLKGILAQGGDQADQLRDLLSGLT